MARRATRTPRGAGPEIDNVIEREAGLRSARDAARILGVDEPTVLAHLERDLLPNAFRATSGHWRIPLEDIVRLGAREEMTREEPAPVAAHRRWRYPFKAPSDDPASWMTPTERRDYMLRLLREQRFLRVSKLSARLGVSQMTVRRDLTRLEADGLLMRTHGGAMANQIARGLALPSAPGQEAEG